MIISVLEILIIILIIFISVYPRIDQYQDKRKKGFWKRLKPQGKTLLIAGLVLLILRSYSVYKSSEIKYGELKPKISLTDINFNPTKNGQIETEIHFTNTGKLSLENCKVKIKMFKLKGEEILTLHKLDGNAFYASGNTIEINPNTIEHISTLLPKKVDFKDLNSSYLMFSLSGEDAFTNYDEYFLCYFPKLDLNSRNNRYRKIDRSDPIFIKVLNEFK